MTLQNQKKEEILAIDIVFIAHIAIRISLSPLLFTSLTYFIAFFIDTLIFNLFFYLKYI